MARCHTVKTSFKGYSAYEEVEPFVIHVLRFFMADMGEVDNVTIALREAVLNAVEHGNKGNREATVRLSLKIWDNGRVSVRVKDAGKGFDTVSEVNNLLRDPDAAFDERVAKGRGWGLFLIRRAVDRIVYNQAGNELLMVKNIVSPLARSCKTAS